MEGELAVSAQTIAAPAFVALLVAQPEPAAVRPDVARRKTRVAGVVGQVVQGAPVAGRCRGWRGAIDPDYPGSAQV